MAFASLQSSVCFAGCRNRVQATLDRPLALVAPAVLAHHEDADRRLVEEASGNALEPVVEPAQDHGIEVDQGAGAEIDPAEPTAAVDVVGPAPDDHALAALASAVAAHEVAGHSWRFNYAETFVVPAAAERFRLVNPGERPVYITSSRRFSSQPRVSDGDSAEAVKEALSPR
jgi:hypothetical protein